jgi:sigma-B regulation protein RsbU (phosphoserine phosphatase)
MWTVVLVVVFNASLVLISHVKKESAPGLTLPDEIQRWLTTTSAFIVAMIASGWALALTLINREGQRFFRVQTEMRLAGEIHQALVPTIDTRIGDFEFYGVSRPSGMVGGDLVDVLSGDGRWLAYVVDVSGHGVSSGVLMAMIKSAIHTALRFRPKTDGLLEAVNWVLCSLKATNMFATCGLIAFSPEYGLRYALAGHLPILRLRDQAIDMLSEGNLPLGIVPEGKFEAKPCEMRKGDVLVVVTDGLTEVSGQDGEEHGFRHISQALRDHGDRPSKEIAGQILDSTNGRRAPSDDQSLLIVRRLA